VDICRVSMKIRVVFFSEGFQIKQCKYNLLDEVACLYRGSWKCMHIWCSLFNDQNNIHFMKV